MKTKILTAIALLAFAFIPQLPAGEFLCGTTAPASTLGADGDVYFNQTTGQLLKKMSGSWSNLQSRFAIKGDKGDRGETGQRGMAGAAGPAGPPLRTFVDSTAKTAATPQFIGQLAVKLDDNTIWRGSGNSAGNWTQLAQGPQGPAGATGPAGAAGPPLTTVANAAARTPLVPSAVNQLIVQADNNTIWRATATTAGAFVQVPTQGGAGAAGASGATGATGATGPQGPAGTPAAAPVAIFHGVGDGDFHVPVPTTNQIVYLLNDSDGPLELFVGSDDINPIAAHITALYFIGNDGSSYNLRQTAP
jgi:hypothetical protein